MKNDKLESIMPLVSGAFQVIGVLDGGAPDAPMTIDETNPLLISPGNYYVVGASGWFTHQKTNNGEPFFANGNDGLLWNDLGVVEVISHQAAGEVEQTDELGVIVEAIDIQHFLDKTNKQVVDTMKVYEQIAAQNTGENPKSLIDIAQELLVAMEASGEELHANQTIEDGGLITVVLAHDTPLIRIQRAMTVCSIMGNEPILPQLTLIDNVTALTVTTILQAQEAYKKAKKEMAETQAETAVEAEPVSVH